MDLLLFAIILVFGAFLLGSVTFGTDSRDLLDDPNEWTSHVGLS